MKSLKLFSVLGMALAFTLSTGCGTNPYANQPDPAAIVAEKVGDSGIRSRASSTDHNVDNATAAQNYANIRSTNIAVRRIVQQPDGTWTSIGLMELSESDGKSGEGIEASYVRNTDGVAIRIGKDSVKISETLGTAISTDVRDQQLDTQDTTRHGLDSGSGLQEAVDGPAIRYEEERTKRQESALNAIPNATDLIPGLPLP